MTDDEHRQRVAVTADVLLAAAADRQMHVSADFRIGESDAAELVGLAPGTLRNLVSQGAGPPLYRIGGRGHRRTVRLIDLAEWIEHRRMTA